MSDILEIRMQHRDVECGLCGADTEMSYGIPTWNGDIVSSNFPDDIPGDHGGGFIVCRACHDKHARGEVPCFDHYYLPTSPFGVQLVNGAGI